jgi:hypothetical protein
MIMRFRDTVPGRAIRRLPAGEQILDLGRKAVQPYYWVKSLKYRKIGRTTWLLVNSRDAVTRRALAGRLKDRELETERLRINLRCAKGPLLIRPRSTDVEVIKGIFRFGEYRAIQGPIRGRESFT